MPSPAPLPESRRYAHRALLQRAGAGAVALALPGLLAACRRRNPAPIDGQGRTDFAPPFAIAPSSAVRPLWALSHGATITDPAMLRLGRGGTAESPWIASTPGATYQLTIATSGTIQVTTAWTDTARHPTASGNTTQTIHNATPITLTTPPNAVGLRLQLRADADDVMVTALSLVLAGGVRVEPFPDFQRAAFAFSYDWESAMGGLIHTRSAANSEGDGTLVALRSDGGPVVAEAEAKGLRMRDGARFLADQFAQHGIKATFYTTGYNLLTGNSSRERFLGNPIYPDADAAHGWGSDYWRTHPWYGDDPFGTEQTHPAWYFASLTHDLANADHEIASHSFGHLYVRGVKPEQLAADLQLWQHTAAASGIVTAPSFAFPWTSSNSLDERFWTIFAELGWTILIRLYPHDLRRPYELDRILADTRLSIFPDFYLPSHVAMLDEALARVEETLARRGYHSLWTHPNEVLEQDGEAVWTRVIAAVAAARTRGVWVAPVTKIARYTRAAEMITVRTAASGQEITIENRSDQALAGLTLTLPWRVGQVILDDGSPGEVRGDQVRLPTIEAGGQAHLKVIPV